MSRLSLKCPECSHQFTLKSEIDSDAKATCPECEAHFAPKPPEPSRHSRDDDDPRPSRRKNRRRDNDDDYDAPPPRRSAPMRPHQTGARSVLSIICIVIGLGIYFVIREGLATHNNAVNTPDPSVPRPNLPDFNQPRFNPPVFNQPDMQGLHQPGPMRTNNQGIGNNQGLRQETPFPKMNFPRTPFPNGPGNTNQGFVPGSPPAFPQPGFPAPGSPGG